jgi:hypothetical protein
MLGVMVVKNLALSPQGGYHAREVLLCKVATTFPSEPLVEQSTHASQVATQSLDIKFDVR